VEAKWENDKYIPTLTEYINNGWMSVSGPLILLHTFFLLIQEPLPTEEALEHLKNYTKIIRLASTIFRLCNDLATSTVSNFITLMGSREPDLPCYLSFSASEIILPYTNYYFFFYLILL